MASAENREQSPKANQPEKSGNSQSLSKIETIKLLNDSIDRLESTIKEISQNSAKDLPSPDSIETLLNTTQELADSVAPPPTPEAVVREVSREEKPAVSATEVEPVTPKSSPKVETKTPQATPIPAAKIKSKPATTPPQKTAAKSSVSNIAKTKKRESRGLAIIATVAIAIAAIALIWLYLPQIKTFLASTSEPTEVIVDREIQPEPTEPKVIDAPVVDNDRNITPGAEDVVVPDLAPTESGPEIIAPIAIPPDLTSPERVKNIKLKTIEPELTFTPEQTLIAALQTKLAEITQNYDSDLWEKIEVDLSQKSLLVRVTDNWYELDESRQNKLANEMLKRTRKLDFNKLEMRDSTGTLVARNPVVGDSIIILQSTRDS